MPPAQTRIAAAYDYRDETGQLLSQVVRYEPKAFRQRRPKPDGGWEWSVKGVRVVPYRLPELLAKPTSPVIVVEGERDADNLAHIALLATCNAGGAGEVGPSTRSFARQAGRRDTRQRRRRKKPCLAVAQSLHGIAAWVRIVDLPGLPPKAM